MLIKFILIKEVQVKSDANGLLWLLLYRPYTCRHRSYILLRQYNNPNYQKINKNRGNEYTLTGKVGFTYSQVRHISHSLWPILEYTE